MLLKKIASSTLEIKDVQQYDVAFNAEKTKVPRKRI